jgi:hypothetical protein
MESAAVVGTRVRTPTVAMRECLRALARRNGKLANGRKAEDRRRTGRGERST